MPPYFAVTLYNLNVIVISENDLSRLLEKQLGDWKSSLMGKSGRQADDQVAAAFQRFFHSCSLKHGPGKVDAIKVRNLFSKLNYHRISYFKNFFRSLWCKCKPVWSPFFLVISVDFALSTIVRSEFWLVIPCTNSY